MADAATPLRGLECGIALARGERMGPDRTFLAAAALLFVASTASTVLWCGSMSAMAGMPMPGGWTMSMAWMPMCGQTWLGVAASFLGMWMVMMAAMMLPSLLPMLWRYRQAVRRTGETRLGLPTVLVGAGYFAVWAAFGMAVFPLGAGLAMAAMQEPALARAAPVASGAAVLLAGMLQLTAWKMRRLACCREVARPSRPMPGDPRSALRHGLRLGVHCCSSCANLTAILLATGVMDLAVMATITAAITAERLLPAGDRVAKGIGAVTVAAGLLLIAPAAGLG